MKTLMNSSPSFPILLLAAVPKTIRGLHSNEKEDRQGRARGFVEVR